MSFRSLGIPIYTAEEAANSVYQKFKPTSNTTLKAVVVGVIFHDDPAFTSIGMEIWTDSSGPQTLIASSATILKASLLTDTYGYRQIGFEFTPIRLRAGIFYNLVPRIAGYTGNAASHIALRQSYPDPQYRTGLTINTNKAATMPIDLSFITEI